MENNQENSQQIDIELNDETALGVYSNLAIITHSNTEFILDFVQMMPGLAKGKVRSRVIVSPFHTKRLLMALAENVRKYEENFGEIDAHDKGAGFPLNFGGPTGQA